jgi:cytochrome P450
MAFLMAMAAYPEAQKAAQDEMDRVVGHGVLPDFTHKAELPYLDAMLKELLRWHQVVPLGMDSWLYVLTLKNKD